MCPQNEEYKARHGFDRKIVEMQVDYVLRTKRALIVEDQSSTSR